MKIVKTHNLACPIDGNRLIPDEKQLCCENGHSFDIARQGYVNLLLVQSKRSKHPGDSKEMVIARTDFLNTGVYQPIAKRLAELTLLCCEGEQDICLLDAGCGEGYYSDFVCNSLIKSADKRSFSFIGLDISKPAIVASAKRNRQIEWIVGTNRQPPIEDNSVDIILCVFGFQNLEGFSKILKPNGVIILVEPGSDHLTELKEIIYADNKKVKSNHDSVENNNFSLLSSHVLQFKTGFLNNKQINNLLLMTPHLFRATKQGKEAASLLERLDISVDVVFNIHQIKQ